MEISFLKTMVLPSTEKSGAAAAVGTVPAFPDSMLNSDTRTGDQTLRDESAAGLNAHLGATELDSGAVETGQMPDETKPISTLFSPQIVLYPGYAPDRLPKSDPREPDMPELSGSDDEAVKLADIDPQSPIMPYRTAGTPETGTTSVPGTADTVGQQTALLTQQADASGPKILAPENIMPVEEGEPEATVRSGQTADIVSGAEKPQVFGPQMLPNIQKMPADPGLKKAVDPTPDTEPSGDDYAMDKQTLALESKKLLNPALAVDNAKPSMPLAATANARLDKQAKFAKLPENADPEAVEIKDPASNATQAMPVNPLAGLRLRQTPATETATGLQIDTLRSLAPSSTGVRVQDANVQTSALPADAVIEFDSAFIENLTREISLIANSKGIARFSLKPEHLGRIDVEIRGGERGDDIKLVAETESVKQFLIQSQTRLEQEIRLHGQRLTSLDIGTGLDQGQERHASESLQTENGRSRSNGGSDDEQTEQQYYAGTVSGQTTSGARYA